MGGQECGRVVHEELLNLPDAVAETEGVCLWEYVGVVVDFPSFIAF